MDEAKIGMINKMLEKNYLVTLSEKHLRLYVGNVAAAFGKGYTSLISRISGLSRTTVVKGSKEEKKLAGGRDRKPGGGAKKRT
jgi:hypothetical protein